MNSSLIKKELTMFFGSASGWVVPGLFLLATSLLLWVIPGSYNIPLNGYANLDGLFLVAPWLLLFLIPAISMQSFAQEQQLGTIELLLSSPVSSFSIVMSKYLALLSIAIIAILPSVLFVFSIQAMVVENKSIDFGAILASYIGLLFLVSVFASIGIYASSLSSNTLFSFLAALFLCSLFYTGFSLLSEVAFLKPISNLLYKLGIESHYLQINRGLIHLSELIYFLLTSSFFLVLTNLRIQKKR